METVSLIDPGTEPQGAPINTGAAGARQPIHACRAPLFNPATDICPQCVANAINAVEREAKKKALRHVEGGRWLVHHLFRYHYLPYWPRNVDRVFATVDIRTGTVVAACVFAYPVLRCHLREQVFGLLSPERLNQHFRQLVRWMVHPDYRDQSVGTELLKFAVSQMDAPVIEAINRKWVPTEAFQSVGFVERSDDTRHYYYRLKECRMRVDEIAKPEGQQAPKVEPVKHVYPRLWQQVARPPGGVTLLFRQPFEGSRIVTHTWKDGTYAAFYEPTASLEAVEASHAFREVIDDLDRAGCLARIQAGIPDEGN